MDFNTQELKLLQKAIYELIIQEYGGHWKNPCPNRHEQLLENHEEYRQLMQLEEKLKRELI